jgi:hypothetical protein
MSFSAKVPFLSLSPSPHQATLEDVLVTDELSIRPTRTADLTAEVEALHDLVRIMATSPNKVIDTLLEVDESRRNAEGARRQL